jgi:hypothetical protein
MANEDDEIEYLTEEEISQAIAVSNFSNIYYVYFDTTGEILSISNERNVARIDSFLEIEYERVEKFISNTETLSDYKISLLDEKPTLVKKTQESVYKTNIFKMIDPTVTESTMLVVRWEKLKSRWVFSLRESYKKQLRDLGLSSKLLFFVTMDSNVNLLVRSIEIDLKELIGSPAGISIPFSSKFENNVKLINIGTRRFFDSYGLLINE